MAFLAVYCYDNNQDELDPTNCFDPRWRDTSLVDTTMAEIEKVAFASAGVRRFGSAALDLAYVAAGRYDGYWERGLAAWDIAAGALIANEAGGRVTDLNGGEKIVSDRSIIVAGPMIYDQLFNLVTKA